MTGNKLKKILSFLLCVCLICSSQCPVLAADNGDYDVSAVTGGVSIDKYKSNEKTVNIPQTINGKKVVAIGSEAFCDNDYIENVVISSNVEKIGSNAFSNCDNLKTVDFALVKSVGAYAFENCKKLNNIALKDSEIGYASFINCLSLDSIALNNVLKVGRFAFQNTKFLNESKDGIVYIGHVAYLLKGSAEACIIEDGITVIADGAFASQNIKSVFIADSVKTIGDFAFDDCQDLLTITVPKSVESIGEYAFGFVLDLEGYKVNSDFKAYVFGETKGESYCIQKGIACEIVDGCKHDENKSYTLNKAPECITDGLLIYICPKCHYTDMFVIPALGHSFGEWTVDKVLSCTQDSTEKRVCSQCNFEEYRTTEKSQGHKWSNWSVATPETCETKGELQRTCQTCEQIDSKEINPLGHRYSSWIVTLDADCKTEGERQCYCEICGSNKTETIPITDEHIFGEWTVTKKATTTEKGTKERICSICEKKEVQELEYVDISNNLVLINGSTLEADKNKYILFLKKTMSSKLLREQFEGYEENNTIVINVADSQAVGDDENVCTGQTVVLVVDNKIIDYYIIALKGDGDGNGKINTSDAKLILRAVAKLETVDDTVIKALDVDLNGKLTTADAKKILRVIAKLESFD